MRLANIGPLWVGLLLRIGFFKTRQAAERRVRLLEAAGRLRYAGRESIGYGKKVHLWCNRRFWDRMLRHEVDAMRIFTAFWPHATARTGRDADQQWRADMDLEIGRMYRLEVDEDTEALHQVRRRLAVYNTCPNAVLFAAPTEERQAEVTKLTANSRIYFSTIEKATVDPFGRHWVNCLGEIEAVSLPGAEGAA